MTVRKSYQWIIFAAVTITLLMLSVSAAMLWLSPAQVAEEFNDPLLSQAFVGEEAMLLQESAQAGAYMVTLEGWSPGRESPTGVMTWKRAAPMRWCPWSERTARP